MKTIAKVLLATFFASSAFVLGGCNTMEGIGQDVKAGGSKLEGEAREHKRY